MIMTLETKAERLEILDVLKGIAIIMVVIRGKKKIKKLGILNKIGKISYDIFLVQMAYYNFGANVILYGVFHNTFIVCLINVLTCIIVGSIYARFEGMIVNKLRKRKMIRRIVLP